MATKSPGLDPEERNYLASRIRNSGLRIQKKYNYESTTLDATEDWVKRKYDTTSIKSSAFIRQVRKKNAQREVPVLKLN
jgi:hypothetical protein